MALFGNGPDWGINSAIHSEGVDEKKINGKNVVNESLYLTN